VSDLLDLVAPQARRLSGGQPDEENARYEVVAQPSQVAQAGPLPAPQPTPAVNNRYEVVAPPAQEEEPQPPQQQPTTGFFGGMAHGAQSTLSNLGRLVTGHAFTDQPETEQPNLSFGGQIGEGVVSGLPSMVAGLATGAAGGAAGGAMFGPPGVVAGTLGGGALGMGATAFAQRLVPAYDEARARGLEHDEAVDYAYSSAAVQGGIMGMTAPLFGLTPIKSIIGRMLFENAVTSPAVGTTSRVVDPLITGGPMPTGEELVTGAAQDVIGGLGVSAALHGGQRVFRGPHRPGLAEDVPPTGKPGVDETVTPPGTEVPPDAGQPVPGEPRYEVVSPPPLTEQEPPPSPDQPPSAPPTAAGGAPAELPPGTSPAPVGSDQAGGPPPEAVVSPRSVPPAADAEAPSTETGTPRTEPVSAERPPGTETTPAPLDTSATPPPTDRPLPSSEIPPRAQQGTQQNVTGNVRDTTENPIVPRAPDEPPPADTTLRARVEGGTQDEARAAQPAEAPRPTEPLPVDEAGRGRPVSEADRLYTDEELARLTEQSDRPEFDTPLPGEEEGGLRAPTPFAEEPPTETGVGTGDRYTVVDQPTLPPGEGRPFARAFHPGDQEPLNAVNAQISRLETSLREKRLLPVQKGFRGETKLAREIDTLEGRRQRLIRTREYLVTGQEPVPETLEARSNRWARRSAAKQTEPRRPLPPREPDAARTMNEYRYNDGTSVYEKVFADAGLDPDVATSLPVEKQINIVRDQMTRPETSDFRDVVVEKGTAPRQGLNVLMDLHRAAQDMIAVLNLPHDLIGLQGKVALILSGKFTGENKTADAFYQFATRSIHLTHERVNAFGHEWIHALDHDLLDRLMKTTTGIPLLSAVARTQGLNITNPVEKAFANIVNTMLFDKQGLVLRMAQLEKARDEAIAAGNHTLAGQLSQGLQVIERGMAPETLARLTRFREGAMLTGDPGYFGAIYEMLARSGESHLGYAAERSGVDPRGFAKPAEGYRSETYQPGSKFEDIMKAIYPQAEDRINIHRAWDEFYNVLAQEGLYPGRPARRSGDTGRPDPRLMLAPHASQQARGLSISRPMQETMRQLRDMRQGLSNASLYDENKPDPRGFTWMQRAAEFARYVTYSEGGFLDSMIETYKDNPAAQRPLQVIRDLLGPPTAGMHRFVGDTWEETSHQRRNAKLNALDHIFTSSGLNLTSITKLQNDQLRHALLTGESTYDGKAMPASVTRAAGDIRRMLNDEYEFNRRAGLDIGYAVTGYLPIKYNHAAVEADRQGFMRQATTLHKRMFDDRVGPPGDDPLALYNKYRQIPKPVRDTMGADLAGGMTELRRNFRTRTALERKLAAETDPAKIARMQAQLDALTQHAIDLAEQHHDALGLFIADQAASEWRAAINIGAFNDFDTVGPKSDYLRQRKLPAYSQDIMKDFLHTDVPSLLADYFSASARRTTSAEMFGAGNERFQALIREAEQAGVKSSHIDKLKDQQERLTGRGRTGIPQNINRALDYVHALGSTMLMSRAMWNGLVEPINTGLANNSLRAGLKAFASQFGQVMHTADSYERARTAAWIGALSSSLIDNATSIRSGGEYADSPQLARFMGKFYKATGLTQVTESGRLASFTANHWVADEMARKLISNSKYKIEDAHNYFNEMGIPPQLHEQYGEWIRSHNGQVPRLEDLTGDPMAGLYTRHFNRATDRSYQMSYRMDRPALANTPLGRLGFQLQGFAYSFTRNILLPLFDRVTAKTEQGYRIAREEGYGVAASGLNAAMRGTAAAVQSIKLAGALVLGTLLTTTVRQYLFATEQFNQNAEAGTLDEYLLGLAVQRSGLNGTFDPLIQVMTSLRYNQDLSTLLEGAGPNYIFANLKNLLAPVISADGKPAETNTRFHNQVRAAYNLVGVPLAALGTTMLSSVGGPVLRAPIGLAAQYLTSANTAAGVADMITGPKGTKLSAGGPLDVDELLNDLTPDTDILPNIDKLTAGEGDGTGAEGGTGAGASVPWGFVDDAIVPLARAMNPVMQRLPGWLKTGAMATGGVVGGASYYNAMEPYREQAR